MKEADFHRLEGVLQALASANRLRLLEALSEPRTLEEIQLPPSAPQAHGRPARPISRPAVLGHLKELERHGVVAVRTTRSKASQPVHQYVADRARINSLLEDIAALAKLGSADPFEAGATAIGGPGNLPTLRAGPKLVLVRGAYEGTAYYLIPSGKTHEWRIGRRRGSAVRLDYDAFVSLDHCEIHAKDGRFVVHPIPHAKNGTWVNWQRLAAPAPIESGDVLGVGKSLLVFRSS